MSSSHPHWRLIETPPLPGADNMALDEALMTRARETGEWVLRIYAWATPTISLGRNQTARGRYDMARIQALGLDVVRRPTGGRAILHHREVTYSVTAPVDGAGDLRESYGRINTLLVAALGLLGVDASPAVAASGRRTPGPDTSPCFAEPSPGELTVGSRKLAGSAQYRVDGALLQHGSILLEDDQSTLATLSVGAGPALPRPASLGEVLGKTPSVSEVAAALFHTVREREDPDATELAPDEELRARASALVVRYMDEAWTWRR